MLRERMSSKRQIPPDHPLVGRKVWVPRMSSGASVAMAAILRSLGIDAHATPPSDVQTLELGGRATGGEECYPLRITVGEFLKLLEQPGSDPSKIGFFMATGQGPCRFGQYVPYVRALLASRGYGSVPILAPAFETGYSDCGDASDIFARSAWRALVSSDILMKYLLKKRPYEKAPGDADRVYEASLEDLSNVLEIPYRTAREQMRALKQMLLRAQKRYRALPVEIGERRPLIGVVGEIFCRLNTFANNELIRRLEAFGAEVWLNDFAEWIWYANAEQFQLLDLKNKNISWESLGARLRTHIQRVDEHEILALFKEDFRGYEEPEITEVLANAEPYLPPLGCSGEMVVNVGKAVYFARKGLDGVVDISPFTCMNGIICEAVYPRVSRNCNGIPIRNFYFDGTRSDLDRDLGIFLELARSYQRRKPGRHCQIV
jgi:predicted nucleotide-binding protein (sugar kinase/HSP70/actin superfamily)